ncbi:glycoside hydrolase [Sphaerosporella brunnea]|uniref:lytic cellulose monooxygenase (C4-dehydrogenating) n=1 Tax=Sphaerosporella brunnea TaxID=1250544 RepID=A0A5J5EYS4_9PEZI|nr:glycoside hydrolase [Sphaerosporella brunnea]
MQLLSTTLLLLSSASSALAHYRFYELIANGQTQAQFDYIRQWVPIYSNSPVTDVTSTNLRCNVDASPASDVISIAAGSTVGFVADTVVTHPGVFTAYLAKAPSSGVLTWDGDGDWFKIWQKGPTSITSSAITWDVTSTQWTFTIPKNTPNGQYLLRFEHIALHVASTVGGAQFYMSCAQIEITGGGSGTPGPTAKIPGVYSATDPGILINIYYPIPTSYTFPGPAVWSG